MTNTTNSLSFDILSVHAAEAYDGDSEDPTSYTLHARVSIDGVPRDTKWSALLDTSDDQRPYTSAGWESSDQWVDAKLALKYEHVDVLAIGEAVIAFANKRHVRA